MPSLVYAGRMPITTTLSQTNVEELIVEGLRAFIKLPQATGGYTLVNPAAITAVTDYPYDLEETL